MGITRKSGFTIVELLIVIVVIGILAAIVIVAFNGVQDQARKASMTSDLRNIKQAINRLEIDTGGTLFGCPLGTFGPEGAIAAANTGLVNVPVAGTVTEVVACTWSAAAVSDWKGPYITALSDSWNRPYRIDLDYFLCEGGTARLVAAVLSMGQDGSLQYPSSTTSGACTTTTSDDIYLELRR